jgi:hypothetical protein
MTVPSTLGAPFLAEGLQRLGLQFELLTHPAVRLLLGSSVLNLGLFSLVFSLVVEFNAKVKDNPQWQNSLLVSAITKKKITLVIWNVSHPNPQLAGVYKCVHAYGLTDQKGNQYSPGTEYTLLLADTYPGGWLDCQIKAGLFVAVEAPKAKANP